MPGTRLLVPPALGGTQLFDSVPEDDDLIALALEALPSHTHQGIFADNAQALYWTC
ncbi:hypothetical protein IC608_17005 [Devosia sp. PTR5]|uniref:Uncharacterized protein n=1 Tax=Devosia oryzisoli TaxID=2774138 RepID=A0A927IUQ7_9HYPH|nr:hypothetical protein [Devosia oryzisoli]MBD8067172.1 hypothetical protein [Devosia oryzisoli]